MADPITRTELENASLDAQALADVVNGPVVPGIVTTREGQSLKTIAKMQNDALPSAADFALHESRLDAIDLEMASIIVALAAGAAGSADIYYATEAAGRADGALINNSYFRVTPSAYGGAYDVWQKISAGAANFKFTMPSVVQINDLIKAQAYVTTNLAYAMLYARPTKLRPVVLLRPHQDRMVFRVPMKYSAGFAQSNDDYYEITFHNSHGYGGVSLADDAWAICSLRAKINGRMIDVAGWDFDALEGSTTTNTGQVPSAFEFMFRLGDVSSSTVDQAAMNLSHNQSGFWHGLMDPQSTQMTLAGGPAAWNGVNLNSVANCPVGTVLYGTSVVFQQVLNLLIYAGGIAARTTISHTIDEANQLTVDATHDFGHAAVNIDPYMWNSYAAMGPTTYCNRWKVPGSAVKDPDAEAGNQASFTPASQLTGYNAEDANLIYNIVSGFGAVNQRVDTGAGFVDDAYSRCATSSIFVLGNDYGPAESDAGTAEEAGKGYVNSMSFAGTNRQHVQGWKIRTLWRHQMVYGNAA